MSKGLFNALVKQLGFWRGLWVYINLGPELNPDDLDETGRDQMAVMKKYRDLGYVSNAGEEGDLHMFFSPSRVPKDLDWEMVRICISLYPIRDSQTRVSRLLNEGDQLPDELRPLKRMTRRRFDRGIRKFLDLAARTQIVEATSRGRPVAQIMQPDKASS